MTLRVTTRGNTATLDFTFYDNNEVLASVTSAEVQLTYPGRGGNDTTEKLTLTKSGNVWSTPWDSTHCSGGWVDYHAHAYVLTYQYAQDGRFQITANRANLDHDALPRNGTRSRDYCA